jgi:hypothetical protein
MTPSLGQERQLQEGEDHRVRGSLTVRHSAHNRAQGGSTPPPATNRVEHEFVDYGDAIVGTIVGTICHRCGSRPGERDFCQQKQRCLQCGHIADGHIHLGWKAESRFAAGRGFEDVVRP